MYYQSNIDVEAIGTVHNDRRLRPTNEISWAIRLQLFMLAILAVVAVVALKESSSTSTFASKFFMSSESPTYTIEFESESPTYGKLVSFDDLPWDTMAEPYRDHSLSVSAFRIDNNSVSLETAGYSFQWKIDDTTYLGSKITVKIEKTGVLDCTLNVLQDDGVLYTQDFTLASKYVRREIRSMTDDDRETYLDALGLLYSTTSTDGKKLYGDKFQTAEYFSYKHLYGAGRLDCDHWHDGAGIVTHHMALTLEVEQALQAVNPTISMPYWEYAEDSYNYEYWFQSPMFQDDWFGAAESNTADHSIARGRWAGISVADGSPYMEWDIQSTATLNPFVNGYGHLRSPWNNNPSTLIGRHNSTYDYSAVTLPSCDLMSACYNSGSYSTMSDCLNGVTHGPVHILIGGLWGGEELFEDKDVSFLQGIDRALFFKMLWRHGYTRCPEPGTCAEGESCVCAVPEEYHSQYGALAMLQDSGIYDIMGSQINYSTDDELLNKILDVIEDPDQAGDMFSSGASYDPSFWPLHGQLERIMSLKRVNVAKGGPSFDETWGYSTREARYLQGVCDWSAITSATDLSLPVCNMTSAAYCWGHGEDDTLEFTNFLGQEETYTNKEMYNFIHPWNDDLPYTYDTFDFDYCVEKGFSF